VRISDACHWPTARSAAADFGKLAAAETEKWGKGQGDLRDQHQAGIERGSPFTAAGFARMISRGAAGAGLELKAHPHVLRHACAPRKKFAP
jgi:site-specific recombinase XerD